MQPFPENAQSNLPGRHVFHQVEHIVVAEEVGGLQRRGLIALKKRVAVLQRDAGEIARAANGARRRLDEEEAVGVCRRVREPRKLATELIAGARALPDGPHDVHHLPVRHPLAARAFALLAFAAGHGALHPALDAGG